MKRTVYFMILTISLLLVAPVTGSSRANDGSEWFEDGRLSALGGNWDHAIEALNDLLARYPTSRYADDAYFWLGYSYNESGRYQEAARSYRELLARYPSSPFADEASLKLARLLEGRLGDRKGAEGIYSDLASNEKADTNVRIKAQTSLARNYEMQKDYPAAVQAYEQTERELAQSPASGPVKAVASRGVEKKKRFIKQSLDESPEALSLYIDAQNLSESGQYSRAEAVLDDLLSRYPQSPVADRAMVLKARNLDLMGRGDEADKLLLEARRKLPGSEPLADYEKERRNKKVLQELRVK